jgi:hypothetical protein
MHPARPTLVSSQIRRLARVVILPVSAVVCATLVSACTGLVVGPESAAVTPVPASRDSAYARARRALTAETFTVDVVDSANGHVTATRYPSSSGQLGTAQACRVMLAVDIQGSSESAELSAKSRWLAPQQMAEKAPTVCEQERTEVLTRIQQTVAPTTASR